MSKRPATLCCSRMLSNFSELNTCAFSKRAGMFSVEVAFISSFGISTGGSADALKLRGEARVLVF
jgi:hypothetical protein